MSKILRKKIKTLKKNKIDILDSYFICKKIDDKLTLIKFKELWA